MAGSIQRRFEKISCVCLKRMYSFSVQQLLMMVMIMLLTVVVCVDCLIRLNRVFCVLVCWCVL